MVEKRRLSHFEVVKDGGASSECREDESESDRYDVVLPKTYHEFRLFLSCPGISWAYFSILASPWLALSIKQCGRVCVKYTGQQD